MSTVFFAPSLQPVTQFPQPLQAGWYTPAEFTPAVERDVDRQVE